MECRDAQFYLRFRRQGCDDLGLEVVSDLDSHLAACPQCAAESRTDSRIDSAFATAMRNIAVPAGLRERLVVNLSAQRGAVMRRRAYRGLAVAASLLLAVGIGFGIVSASRPVLDIWLLAEKNAPLAENPDKSIHDWLKAEKLPVELPLPLDTSLLVSHGFERVQGRSVPVIAFRAPPNPPLNGAGFAKLYIVREGTDFDLRKIESEAQNSTCGARVIRDPRYPGVVYVFVYTGDPTQFLKFGYKI